LFDHNDLFRLHDFCFHFLLLGGFQVAGILRFLAHALNSIHHVALLGQKCIAEIRGPLDIIGEALHYIRKGCQALYTWIPRLFRDRIHECLILQAFVLCQPLLELNDFQWVGGRSKNLREHRVGVERDRSYQRIKLIWRDFDGFLLTG